MEQAERERRKAIEAAVTEAKTKGQVESNTLMAEGQKKREQLGDKAKERMESAVAKVLEYLRG